MTDKHEALIFADDRRTSSGDDLYEWAIDAEDWIRRLHARIAELEAKLESIAASAGSEPVATVFTMEALAPGGGVKYHATVHKALPAGTKLYTHQSPPEGMVGGWMPIETAPKDGTAILLGSRGGSWIGKWLPVYVSGYRPANPWSSLMLNHDHMGEKWVKPTHWMPLPLPPTTAADSGNGGES